MLINRQFRALTLAAVVALSMPMTAFASGSVGNSAVPSESFYPMATTAGSINMAVNTGNAASANGDPLAAGIPVVQYLVGRSIPTNRGGSAVTSHDSNVGTQG